MKRIKLCCEISGIILSLILICLIFIMNCQEISIKAKDTNVGIIRIWLLGLLISMGLGNFIVRMVMKCLKAKILEHPGRFTLFLGLLESLSYTVSWTIGKPEFIAVWLGIKMAGRWSSKEERHKKGEINSFLIGNLLTVIFSVLAGIIILYLKNNGWNITAKF